MKFTKHFASSVCLVIFSATSNAAEYHVYPGQPIQFSIDIATHGDVIIVHQGTYWETLNMLGKAVTLRSEEPTNPAVVANTIINGDGQGPVITCDTTEGNDTIISGFTITNGSSSLGGGMFNYYSSPDVNHCTFSGNEANDKGGGMYNNHGEPVVRDCTFTNNTAWFKGGGMYNDNCTTTILDCTFSSNMATQASLAVEGGGAIHSYFSTITISNCSFTDNSTNMYGSSPGGAIQERSCNSTTITNCLLENNSTHGVGGGIYSYLSPSTISECTFSNNTAINGGGGVYICSEDSTISSCVFNNNMAGLGGGIYVGCYSPTISDCHIHHNTLTFGFGGGIASPWDGNPIISNTQICSNSPDQIHGSFTSNGGLTIQEECPVPTGACCIGEGCIETSDAADCSDAGGTFMGHESDCATVTCPEPCPADLTGDGQVNIDDIFAILGMWGLCP